MGSLSSISQEGNAPAIAASKQRDLLLALAARCEREPPNRDLDGAIWDLLCVECDWRGGNPKRFTTSLDAAVMLVPEKARWVLEIGPPPDLGATVYPDWDNDPFDKECAFAKTPALSLCTAALKARAAVAELEQASMKSGEATQDPPLHISDFLGG